MAKNKIAEILEWFAAPGAKTLHNADLLSYGYDNPSIDCVGIMRLSRSLPMPTAVKTRSNRSPSRREIINPASPLLAVSTR